MQSQLVLDHKEIIPAPYQWNNPPPPEWDEPRPTADVAPWTDGWDFFLYPTTPDLDSLPERESHKTKIVSTRGEYLHSEIPANIQDNHSPPSKIHCP